MSWTLILISEHLEQTAWKQNLQQFLPSPKTLNFWSQIEQFFDSFHSELEKSPEADDLEDPDLGVRFKVFDLCGSIIESIMKSIFGEFSRNLKVYSFYIHLERNEEQKITCTPTPDALYIGINDFTIRVPLLASIKDLDGIICERQDK